MGRAALLIDNRRVEENRRTEIDEIRGKTASGDGKDPERAFQHVRSVSWTCAPVIRKSHGHTGGNGGGGSGVPTETRGGGG